MPIIVTFAGITSMPSKLVAEKAPSLISTSEVAFERSRPVSLELAKPPPSDDLDFTAGPTLSVPV